MTIFAKSNIVILGDSLSAGFGIEQKKGWVTLLEQRIQQQHLPYHIINASISGETTVGGRQRLQHIIQQHQPQILILELGGNDGLRGLSLNVIKDNLSAMITLCLNHQVQVVLVGIRLPPNYGPIYTQRFSQIFSDIAKENNVPLVPSILAGLEDDLEDFQPDGIHPTTQAQPILLDNVWTVLSPLLQTQEVTLSLK